MLRAGAVVADEFETRAGKGLFYLRFDCFKRNHNRYNVTTLQRYIVTTLHRYNVTSLHRYIVTSLKRYKVRSAKGSSWCSNALADSPSRSAATFPAFFSRRNRP